MFEGLFTALRDEGVPVALDEWLMLHEALERDLHQSTLSGFYLMSRAVLVKDEAHYDGFDIAFARYFSGIEPAGEAMDDKVWTWLHANPRFLHISEDQRKRLDEMRDQLELDELLEKLKEKLENQEDEHHGGSEHIGTGGTSPFGHGGYNPEGIRIGGPSKGNRTAVKVWEARAYRDYDDTVELGTRNIKVALRRLRKFARDGADIELDLDDTIHSTAANAGLLDIKMRPERHNNVKVLMLMDVGGSMDDHIKRVEELFSAAKTEFKHLEYYYFHNCVYEHLWKHNRRRHAERFSTWDVIRKYPPDYKLIFVGDATMSPYEILQAGGSVEYNNAEAGAVWLRRLVEQFPKFAWLNPEPEGLWEYRQSISVINQIMKTRMFPVTIAGLESAMRLLSK